MIDLSAVLEVALGAAAPSTALPDHPGLWENVQFQLVGLTIVLGALSCLYLLCAAVGLLFKSAERAGTSPAVAPADGPGEVVAPDASELAPPEVLVVVIAAAVAAVLDEPYRLVSIDPATGAWATEGRRQIFVSHKLRR